MSPGGIIWDVPTGQGVTVSWFRLCGWIPSSSTRTVSWLSLTSLLIVAAAASGPVAISSIRWVSRSLALAVVLLIAVIIFGALVVLQGLSPGLAAVDLGSALMVLALALTATVVAFARHADPTLPERLLFHSAFAKLTLWTLVAVFMVLVSGVLVAKSGSLVRCLGWPLYGGQLVPVDVHGWLRAARLLLATAAGMLLIAVIAAPWRLQAQQRGSPPRRDRAGHSIPGGDSGRGTHVGAGL